MPLDAAMPEPTMTAVGAARPTAQGQAMTSTEMPNSSAKTKSLLSSGSQLRGKEFVRPARSKVSDLSVSN